MHPTLWRKPRDSSIETHALYGVSDALFHNETSSLYDES